MKRREFLRSIGIVGVVAVTAPLSSLVTSGVNKGPIIYTSLKTYGQLSISGVAMDARYRYFFTPDTIFRVKKLGF